MNGFSFSLRTKPKTNPESKFDENVMNATYDSVKEFKPVLKYGKVIKVYDGDTITLAAKLPFSDSGVYRFSCRIMGIDCPEMRTRVATEKHCAILARDMVADKIMGKMVYLKNEKYDKYGRVCADIYCVEDGVCIKDMLIGQNLAVAYDGGTKNCPDDWLEYYQSRKTTQEIESLKS